MQEERTGLAILASTGLTLGCTVVLPKCHERRRQPTPGQEEAVYAGRGCGSASERADRRGEGGADEDS
eukprot:2209802-Prymnesium_polylepis.1